MDDIRISAPLSPINGAVSTFEIPLTQFPGEIPIGASTDYFADIQTMLGGRCCGFTLTSIFGSVQVSINGGGWRTVAGPTELTGALVSSLRVLTGAGSSCLLTINGF